jgi:hypothetical protein
VIDIDRQKSCVLAFHSTIRSTGRGTTGSEVTHGLAAHTRTEQCRQIVEARHQIFRHRAFASPLRRGPQAEAQEERPRFLRPYCPFWARTRTFLIERPLQAPKLQQLATFTRVVSPRCWSSPGLMLDFAAVRFSQMSKFADPVDCRPRLGRARYGAECGDDATPRRFLIRSRSGPQACNWGESARRVDADADVAPWSGFVTGPRRMSSPPALDRSDPQAYVGPAYKLINAHPAKAGVAKPRVLASPATPEV